MEPRALSPFERDIEQAINRHSQEGASNTPDFILAQYLGACLAAWNEGIYARETWYGRGSRPIASPLPATINDAAMRSARVAPCECTDQTRDVFGQFCRACGGRIVADPL